MDFSVLSDACGASEFIVSEFLEGIRGVKVEGLNSSALYLAVTISR